MSSKDKSINTIKDAIEIINKERKQRRDDITHQIHILLIMKMAVRFIWENVNKGVDAERLKVDIEAIFTLVSDLDNINRRYLEIEIEKEDKKLEEAETVLH